MHVTATPTMNPFVPILCVLTLLVGPALVWKISSWIAQPLDVAAKHRRHATQFTIVDFLCLFVLVQAPTALIHSIKTGGATGIVGYELFILDVYAWISIGFVWWKAAEITSRAGINTPWHRIVLLIVVLPTALVGPLLPFVFTIVTAIGMVKFTSPAGLVTAIVCIVVGTPLAMVVSARLVRRIVAASDAVAELAVEVVEDTPRPPQSEPLPSEPRP